MQQDNTPSVLLFEKQEQDNKPGPVECLGLTFESDEQRRESLSGKLKEKLADPEFKSRGFSHSQG